MEKKNILAVIGGISRDSLNKKFFNAIKESAPDEFHFIEFDISTLPYFSQDIENDPPDSVVEWKDRIREADAILFVTPEYNRSYPGVLKNSIDWGSRPYGENLWDKKPAAVTGASPSAVGTFGAQHHLRQALAYLNLFVMGQPELYFNANKGLTDQGELKDAKTQEIISAFWQHFEEFIDRVSPQMKVMNKSTQESSFRQNH
jgi:chromate reductase, NAD(P)H dehydrogenase (quinone)